MKTRNLLRHRGILCNTAVALISTTGLLMAHPGHYHPGEEDEFDALRATFLHLHGNLEIGLAAAAVAAVLVFGISNKRPLRVAAAIALCASLAGIAAF
jgi:hypothetical protein